NGCFNHAQRLESRRLAHRAFIRSDAVTLRGMAESAFKHTLWLGLKWRERVGYWVIRAGAACKIDAATNALNKHPMTFPASLPDAASLRDQDGRGAAESS